MSDLSLLWTILSIIGSVFASVAGAAWWLKGQLTSAEIAGVRAENAALTAWRGFIEAQKGFEEAQKDQFAEQLAEAKATIATFGDWPECRASDDFSCGVERPSPVGPCKLDWLAGVRGFELANVIFGSVLRKIADIYGDFGTFGDQRLITCELRKRADAHQPNSARVLAIADKVIE
jgi:hypothetical protein